MICSILLEYGKASDRLSDDSGGAFMVGLLIVFVLGFIMEKAVHKDDN